MLESFIKRNMNRFYFWTYCKPYGWRQMGRMDGYETKTELEIDCETAIRLQKEQNLPYRVMATILVEECK